MSNVLFVRATSINEGDKCKELINVNALERVSWQKDEQGNLQLTAFLMNKQTNKGEDLVIYLDGDGKALVEQLEAAGLLLPMKKKDAVPTT